MIGEPLFWPTYLSVLLELKDLPIQLCNIIEADVNRFYSDDYEAYSTTGILLR